MMEHSSSALPGFIRDLLEEGPVSFHRYIEACLYDPRYGYYRHSRKRVGQREDTDFFTNTTHRRIFGPLLLEAARAITGLRPGDWKAVVEVATEPEGGVFGNEMDFSYRPLPLGHSLRIEGGPFLVIANEWLDAQAFHRLEFSGGQWRELGVAIAGDKLVETHLDHLSAQLEPYLSALPCPAPPGYRVDLPTGAVDALDRFLRNPWHGLFICFDYGSSWSALTRDFSAGTARTYRHHRQGSNLLETPGQRDITCHLCWDHLSRTMEEHGFKETTVERQEAFFMRRCGKLISQWMESEQFPEARGPLRELLHPAYLGTSFQVMFGQRPENPAP